MADYRIGNRVIYKWTDKWIGTVIGFTLQNDPIVKWDEPHPQSLLVMWYWENPQMFAVPINSPHLTILDRAL